MRKTMVACGAALALACIGAQPEPQAKLPAYPFMDTSLSFEERAADLVSRMTLEEKVSQLGRNTAAVPRLGLAKYDYWNEALHGIQNGTGEGTSFPMPLSLAATWDEAFIAKVASAIADECRGHNQPLSEGGRGRGLTYWCPTINLDRHPLWGRTNEAYGEDAYLAGMLSSAFVEGMKGEGPYLKTVPTIKHYALNNHENLRGSTSSDAGEKDIRDYYARVYRYVIERTDVPSLMSAYNAVNYTPSSANRFLLTTLLRQTFGFTGFVTSDCGAIDNIERSQKWQPARNSVQKGNYPLLAGRKLADYVDAEGVVTKPGSVAMALMAGCDMDCNGDIYPKQAKIAHDAGLVSEGQIAVNVYNNLLARFKLGEFDPDEKVLYRDAAYSFANTVETPEHRALAEEAATRGVVLLKNEGGLMPLDAKRLRRLVVVGDCANACFLGNYHGKPKEKNRISVFAGISDYLFVHNPGCELTLVSAFGEGGAIREEDKAAIRGADAVLVVAADEHEDSSEGHDRPDLRLSRNQNEIVANVAALNPRTIVFLQTSNMVELGAFKDAVKSIFWSSQNGQAQGVGVANQLFGESNPSGKLTFTWYASEAELPGIRQYGMTEKFLPEEKDYPKGGFTYQYFRGAVDYPFGHGISYTTYSYANARLDKSAADANDKVRVSVDVTNTGKRAGSEVVQVYVAYPKGRGLPVKQLKGYAKLDLEPGETKTATVEVDVADCCFWDGTRRVVPQGEYAVEVGASAADIKFSRKLAVSGALAETVNVVSVNPGDVAVKVGGRLAPQVSVCLKDDRILPAGAAKLQFASTNAKVASVAADGTVTGVAPGVATIAVKATYKGSSKTASFPVAVVPAGGAVDPAPAADATAAIESLEFPDVKVPSAKAGAIKLAAKAVAAGGAPVKVTYAIVADGMQTAPATLKGDVLSVKGEGRVTVSATAECAGAKRFATAQVLVSDRIDRDALEGAIRIKVAGDDYDPVTFAAYEAEVEKARRVLFNDKATQAEVDAAFNSLTAVKEHLRDYRYMVADFRPANKTYSAGVGKNIWVNWANCKDAEGRNTVADFTTHDPRKLELRFTITLKPSDYKIPYLEAAAGGNFIKLRSTNVAQKDNDPDLQVFGGRLETNNEHNYGWRLEDYVTDWGTTEVAIPLAQKNPDGSIGLPLIDKGIVADGKSRYSRGKIDWSCIETFFLSISFKDAFRKSCSCSCTLANVRVVDVTLEEEREKLGAMLAETVTPGCDCPGKVEVYERLKAEAREVMALENVVNIKKAAAALVDGRKDIMARVKADKSALKAALAERVADLKRYTPESAAAYSARFDAAQAAFADAKATQLAVNRAVAGVAGAKALLKLVKVSPYVVGTLLEGEKSVESHGLNVSVPADIDLAADADYIVTVRYDVKLETTHAKPVTGNGWLKCVVNGKARVWGATGDGVQIASMNCERDSVMTAYSRPGEWFQVNHEIPVSKLAGGRLTRFETYMFNDTGKYAPDPDDGNKWNNDTGVKMTVRNIQVFSDRPKQ